MSRTLYLQIQTRLHRNSQGALLTSSSWARYSAWKQFLQGIDNLVLIARISHEVDERGHLVEGPGVSVMPLPFYSGISGLIKRLPSIYKFVRELPEGPNVYYGGRAADPLASLIQRKARRSGSHFIIQLVGDPAESLSAGSFGKTGRLLSGVVGFWTRHQVKKSSAVIYVTRYVLQQRYPPASDAITLARSNIEFTAESFAERARDYRSNPIGNPLKLITVGGHSQKFKGHDLLLEAISDLRRKGIATETRIVGGGRYSGYYNSVARDLQVDDIVHFEGHLADQNQIRKLLSDSDLFVLPSLTEGLPRALLEAMAQGIASIASDVGGTSELLPPEGIFTTGSSQAISDKVSEVKDDVLLLTKLSVDGLKKAREIEINQAGSVVLGDFMRRVIEAKPNTKSHIFKMRRVR